MSISINAIRAALAAAFLMVVATACGTGTASPEEVRDITGQVVEPRIYPPTDVPVFEVPPRIYPPTDVPQLHTTPAAPGQ